MINEPKKSKLVRIEATVMSQTYKSFRHNQRDTGFSIGEVIDRLAVQILAKDTALAVQIILEEIQIILRGLPSDRQIAALWNVITTVTALMSEKYLPKIQSKARRKQTALLEKYKKGNSGELV